MMPDCKIIVGDCLESLRAMPDESVQCCVTSPPFWGLRDYGHTGQLGLEATPSEYVANLVTVFAEVRRVLKADGVLWLNLGDCHATGGLKPKDLVGIPWRVAFALQADGWWLRSDVIWAKPNCMPESVTDRPTRSHEYLFLLAKAEHYYYDHEAIKEPGSCGPGTHGSIESRKARANPETKSYPDGKRNGIRPEKQRGHSRRHDGFNDRWDAMDRDEQCSGMRNKRSVWTVAPANYPDAHFATWPPELIQPCILAGTKTGDVVLDPFGGSGTTGMVALELGRSAILCELNPAYAQMARERCTVTPGLPFE